MANLAPDLGSGSGSSLPFAVLLLAGLSTASATFVSAMSIALHLKNYRKPILQRQVVRIMLMVPIYAISSFVSLVSLDAAFYIDVVRDIYEAFVIYCFFDLLIAYLGGERSLLIMLHGRPPKYPIFPGNIFWREVDVSDPFTFLFLKRGVIQYVQVKPILALATVILKLLGKFHEGDLRASSGYLYISIVYNASICLSLYCLAMFWMCVHEDLKPFRPMPKFLCVKGILFFSFWQSIFISILVAGGAIKKLGPYTDREHISLGLIDTLICIEMPFFAVAHLYAFSTQDFVSPNASYVARMRMWYAFRDAFGLKDVIEDIKSTLRGEGMDYREFEPSEGQMHQGLGRERRIRAGLRYSQGGKKKYWLPQVAQPTRQPGSVERRVNGAVERFTGRSPIDEVYAPLLSDQADDVVHTASDLRSPRDEGRNLFDGEPTLDEGFDLPFGDIEAADEELFEHSKKYLFGDYLYPCVDVSSESARNMMWQEEERILRHERGAYFSPLTSARRVLGQRDAPGYGAVGSFNRGGVRERVDSTASARQKGKTRDAEIVIDKEQAGPDARPGEVKLTWTSSRDRTPVHTPRVRTPSIPTRPRASSSTGPSPLREDARRVLPPDAVDLVVEDPGAAEEEMAYERRKGEPAVRGTAGLHKVYRRGYVVGDEAGQVEVDAEEPPFAIGDDEADAGDVLEAEEAAVDIVRAETPPIHARVVSPQWHIPDSDDNPWA